MISDLVSGLVSLVRADPEVAVLTAKRVYGISLARTRNPFMPERCVVITVAGGSSGADYLPIAVAEVDFRCYGRTPAEAMEVWRTVHPVLRDLDRSIWAGTQLHWARMISGPFNLVEPNNDWPLVYAAYEIQYAEEAAA